jgi:hypothetical protein
LGFYRVFGDCGAIVGKVEGELFAVDFLISFFAGLSSERRKNDFLKKTLQLFWNS